MEHQALVSIHMWISVHKHLDKHMDIYLYTHVLKHAHMYTHNSIKKMCLFVLSHLIRMKFSCAQGSVLFYSPPNSYR